jgi:hypothetical protein
LQRKPLFTKVRRSSVFNFAFFNYFAGLGGMEGAATTMTGRHRWLHRGSSSSTCRSWCSSLGTHSSSKSQVSSLAFARCLWGWTDYSDNTDYSVAATVDEMKGGDALDLRVEECKCWK